MEPFNGDSEELTRITYTRHLFIFAQLRQGIEQCYQCLFPGIALPIRANMWCCGRSGGSTGQSRQVVRWICCGIRGQRRG